MVMDGLLERETERSALREGCVAVGGGAGLVILVVGEAGIGKTALLHEARGLAGELGVRVLRASGAMLERDVLDRATARLHDQAPTDLSGDDQNTLADLRTRVGLDQLNRALTSAAPCPLGVQAHYHALGVPFAEFYAMSELGVPTSGALGVSDLGTVGWPTSGHEVTLDQDGEVLVRTDSRARGYRNLPAETAETFGQDGFVRTGDVGAFDERGRLRIIDRKKEFLIDEHGHNTAPAPIESALKSACPLIGHVCLVGEGRPHLTALILLEPPQLASDASVAAQVADAIQHVNADSDPRERIQGHTILTAPWLPGEELTETLKLRRRRIAEKHADTIAAMY
jgi:long-chain acyl-CoA synthetase